MNYQHADLQSLIAAVNNVANDARNTFGRLSPAQPNWKPSAERWSVAQCFDHLLASNRGYYPIIDGVLAGKKRSIWQSMPVLPGAVGRWLIKSLDRVRRRHRKAPRNFQPAQTGIRASVIDDFVAQQATIFEKMKATEHLHLDRRIINSPAASVGTYSLMDAHRL